MKFYQLIIIFLSFNYQSIRLQPIDKKPCYNNAFYALTVFFNLFQVTEPLKQFLRNLDTQNSTNMRILRELCKELAEPLGSTDPG
jgi:hypothetical protein